jgi:hypothetical protein
MRGKSETAAHRCHRSLSGASMGRLDAPRGDDGGARQPRGAPARCATSAVRTGPAGT